MKAKKDPIIAQLDKLIEVVKGVTFEDVEKPLGKRRRAKLQSKTRMGVVVEHSTLPDERRRSKIKNPLPPKLTPKLTPEQRKKWPRGKKIKGYKRPKRTGSLPEQLSAGTPGNEETDPGRRR